MGLICPECGSGDFQSIPLLYSAQTSRGTTSGTTIGVGVIGDAFGVGGARSSFEHVHQSDLARTLAPPAQPKSPVGCYVASGCGFYLLYLLFDAFWLGQFARNLPGAILGCVLLVGIVALIIRSAASPEHARAMDEWRRRCGAWERSLLCMRCGKRFENGG